MNDFQNVLDKLDKSIDKLATKYGMTHPIDKVHEKWTNLMFAYHTDFRNTAKDIDDFVSIAATILQDIQKIEFSNENQISERMQGMTISRQVAVSNANLSRFGNELVVVGEQEELLKINNDFQEKHKIMGKYVDYTGRGGPKGLMFDNRQESHLNDMGIKEKSKRQRDDTFEIKKTKKKKTKNERFAYQVYGDSLVFDNEIADVLRSIGMSFTVRAGGQVVLPTSHFIRLSRHRILGGRKPEDFEVYNDKDSVAIVVGKQKDIDEIRKIIGVTSNPMSGYGSTQDLVVVGSEMIQSVNKFLPFDIPDVREKLPSSLLPLLYKRYPSRKPRSRPGTFAVGKGPLSLDDVMGDETPLKNFNLHSTTTDWFYFRGNIYYTLPWARYMASNTGNGRSFHNSTSYTSGIYYIPGNREGQFVKELRVALNTPHDKIILTDTFVNEILNPSTRVLYTFLSHQLTATSKHSNPIVIDKDRKTILRFEPHGYSTKTYDIEKCDDAIKDMMSRVSLFKEYSYISPSDYQAEIGPQKNETRQTAFKRVVARFGSTVRLVQASGFCKAWAMYFHFMMVQNYSLSLIDFGNRVFCKTPNKLAQTIRIFQSWLVKLSKEYHGESYIPTPVVYEANKINAIRDENDNERHETIKGSGLWTPSI